MFFNNTLKSRPRSTNLSFSKMPTNDTDVGTGHDMSQEFTQNVDDSLNMSFENEEPFNKDTTRDEDPSTTFNENPENSEGRR